MGNVTNRKTTASTMYQPEILTIYENNLKTIASYHK